IDDLPRPEELPIVLRERIPLGPLEDELPATDGVSHAAAVGEAGSGGDGDAAPPEQRPTAPDGEPAAEVEAGAETVSAEELERGEPEADAELEAGEEAEPRSEPAAEPESGLESEPERA